MRRPLALAIIGMAAGVVGEAASSYLPNTPPWIWGIVFWAGIAVIAGAVVWGFWSHAQAKKQTRWLRMWDARFDRRDTWPYRRVVPMEEAARIAYEQTRDTLSAKAAERDAESILGYYATALWDGVTNLYGVRPPSTKLELVPDIEANRCGFIDDGAAIKRHGAKEVLYDKLYFKKSDLRRRIKELKDIG